MMTDLFEEADAIATILAKIELHNFAIKLGLKKAARKEISEAIVRQFSDCLDELSWERDELAARIAILMVSILWEYAEDEVKQALRQRIILALSRLGLSPTTMMIDRDYRSEKKYAAFDSYRSELATIAMQLRDSENVAGKEYLLTSFQKRVLNNIQTSRIVGVSAPTSAGKSFALYLAIARHFVSGSEDGVVYIVPTISLIQQVVSDIRRTLNELSVTDVIVTSSANQSNLKRTVSVVTQERALYALDEGFWKRFGLLIVDEVQNLEKVSSDDEMRSKILYDSITDLNRNGDIGKIIISGPRLENIGELGSEVFGGSAEEVTAVEGPVAGLTYSIHKENSRAYIKQYCEILKCGYLELAIDDHRVVQGQGQSRYTDAFINFLGGMVNSVGSNVQSVIFSPTSDQAVHTAQALRPFVSSKMNSGHLSDLVSYLSESVHPHYTLTNMVSDGICYHNGKVPPHARFAVEGAYREGWLRNIVCTTTLMQGVNLPAEIVFIRNPNLYIRAKSGGENPSLSAYDFSNLRGRAGRLMQDLIGRTVVLDEGSFIDGSGQGDLFFNATKTVRAGYGHLYENNREDIISELESPGSGESGAAKYVSTYVRQMAIKRGVDALDHIRGVGIGLDSAQYAKVVEQTLALGLDVEVCSRNRYWDPFDLRLIFDSAEAYGLLDLPNSVWDLNFTNILTSWIKFHADVAPYYFSRYISSSSTDKFITALSLSSGAWARETPLRKIIDNRHFGRDDSKKIDDQISLIFKHVVYGIPSLLKPLVDFRGQGEGALAAIESGSFHPVTRLFMREGLFRETSVMIREKCLPEIGANIQGSFESEMINRVLRRAHDLNYWVVRELDEFTNWRQ